MLFAFENRVGSVHVKCRHESGKPLSICLVISFASACIIIIL